MRRRRGYRRRRSRRVAAALSVWGDVDTTRDDVQLAVQLIAQPGAFFLESLVDTVTEVIERPKQDLTRDVNRLTEAHKDLDAVKSCWQFLAYAMTVRLATRASETGAQHEQGVYEAASAFIGSFWPRPKDENAVIRRGLEAPKLGYGTLEGVYTYHAFSHLLGKGVGDLTLFRDTVTYFDEMFLLSSWESVRPEFDEVIFSSALANWESRIP